MQARVDNCRRLTWGCLGLAALFAGYHLLLVWLMRHTGLELGVVGPGRRVVRLVPLYMYWAPRFKLSLVPAVMVLGGLVAWGVPRLIASRRSTRWLILALIGCQLAVATSVGMVDGGPGGLARPYRDLAASDYIGAVDRVTSPREFLASYPQLIPSLPVHCQTHPPGAVLFLWIVAQVFGPGPMPAALATILTASVAVPAVYLLARRALDERRARLATCLYLLAPSVVLFSATSMDAVFAVPLVWTSYLIWKGSEQSPWLNGALAGLTAAVAALLTFSIAVLAMWGLVLLALDWRLRPGSGWRTCRTLAAAVLSAVAFYAVLYLLSGYNPVATFLAALGSHHRVMASTGHETFRQHAHFMVANLVAFFSCAGLALTLLFGSALWASIVRWPSIENARPMVISFAVAVLAVDCLPLYTLEVEHIWLFLIPWVAIGAASQLPLEADAERLPPAATLALALAAAQTLAMELLLHTYW